MLFSAYGHWPKQNRIHRKGQGGFSYRQTDCPVSCICHFADSGFQFAKTTLSDGLYLTAFLDVVHI